MWTSQEYDFSKRRLIFKEGQVKWKCNCTEWSEDHIYDSEKERLRGIPPRSYIGHEAQLRVPSLSRLSQLVQTFNAKTLRYEEDVYAAFSGYNTYLNSIFPSGLVYGHPQLFFDISLCWHSIGNMGRRTVSRRYTGDPLRNGLPSWSWMGWKGNMHFPAELEGETVASDDMGFTEAVAEWYAKEYPESLQKQWIKSQWSEYRNAPRGSMAELWRCEEFKPPATYDTITQRTATEPRAMPKEMPRYRYYCSLDDSPTPATRRYPIPLNLNDSNGSQAGLHSGFQYLWCQTFREFLIATQDIIGKYRGWQQFDLLKNLNGVTAGALCLHNEADGESFQQNTQVELIAIAKGWTSVLSSYKPFSCVETETDSESEDEQIATESSEDGTEWSRVTEDEEPWMEHWEDARKHKQDCYHVLWIEWKDSVAYRKSYGFVLEKEWDRVVEASRVDITLG